ncbi:MAG TPA: YraN family protein [Patescibacteria group bacterium]|nr:YraN family protein [Patescibacteria group bacterium]
MNTRELGRSAEKLAERYLIKKGYRILERNWTCHGGELDLIASDPCGVLDVDCGRAKPPVFVEVKSIGITGFCAPYELFGYRKQRKLLRAINKYLSLIQYYGQDWRLDLICLTKVPGRYVIEHFEDVLHAS